MKTKSNNKQPFLLKNTHVFILECIIILVFCLFPIFRNYSLNKTFYLSWEGAYRLYLGQIPYKDFGLPMGFGYWIIPAIFFKIFGPYLFTLIKAQVFINLTSAFAFHSILKSFKVSPPLRLLGIFLFLLSYTYINAWPWYNHTVIVFELIGIAFLLRYIFGIKKKFSLGYLFGASFFIFLSFFTKQDGGALAFLIGVALIISHAIYEKKIMPIVWFFIFYIFVALCFFLPFLPYHIGYWFNYGQPPHYDRISIYEIINIFLGESTWIKFYILIIGILLTAKARYFKLFISDKYEVLFTILVIGVLFEATIIQETSYTPENGNIFFHSFAIIYIAILSGLPKKINFRKPIVEGITAILILLWWSPFLWGYADAVLVKHYPNLAHVDSDRISIRSYLRGGGAGHEHEEVKLAMGPWKQFERFYLPEESIKGIKDILNLDIVKEKGHSIRLLNMSELTPLESILGYIPETGPNIPLWYHKNVGMFDKQINMYKRKIKNNYYDLVVFEYLPDNNNFYPFVIRRVLKEYYQQVGSFSLSLNYPYSLIEVYVKKKNNDKEAIKLGKLP